MWSQQAKVTASDAAVDDYFGFSVSVSGDTTVVGAYQDDDGGTESGSAYVFVRSAGVWRQQAKLTASDAAAWDLFGKAVSVSGDTAVMGAVEDDDGGSSSGSAYVFVRSGTTWSLQAKLTASDAVAFDRLGRSVSVSGDTVVIGAFGTNEAGDATGSAYVFVRNGTTWSEQARLWPSDGAQGDYFGLSVSVSGDTAVIGALYDSDGGRESGSAYVYVRAGSGWTQQAKLRASDPAARGRFGTAVSVSGDTAVVGSLSGSAYVMTWYDAIDADGDDVLNLRDNCPFTPNPTQADADGDGLGDACDTTDGLDADSDGVANTDDNCPFTANAGQEDADADGLGDACDGIDGRDVDGDGITNTEDNCPFAANDDQADTDGDGLGDACDASEGLDDDVDGDGVANTDDNCAFDANADQADGDADGLGDACDETDGLDVDGDGVANTEDNCPFAANDGQQDTDADGLGDACDAFENESGGGCSASGSSGAGTFVWLLGLLGLAIRRRAPRRERSR